VALEQLGEAGCASDRVGAHHLARLGEALHPGRDVHRAAEVVDLVVGVDRHARPAVNSDFQHQLRVELRDLAAHRHRGLGGDERLAEHRHHRVADRLHHRATPRRHRLAHHVEVGPHQVERLEVSDSLVERGRGSEVVKRMLRFFSSSDRPGTASERKRSRKVWLVSTPLAGEEG